MHFHPPMLVALVALLASSVAGLGLRSDLARKLQISAELGLDVNAVVGNGTSFRTMVAGFTDGETPAEYVSVGIWTLLQRSMIVMQANATCYRFQLITTIRLSVLMKIGTG
jgi:hypothetical protein